MAAPSSHPDLPAFLTQSKQDIYNKFVDLEWAQRNRLLQGTQPSKNGAQKPSPWERLQGHHIAERNRYSNVEPFADNRVKLRVAAGLNDYINASPIQLGKRRYIATQGPVEGSVNHFYRMLNEEVHEPAIVVMLTQTHESGKEKCFQYFPLSMNAPLLQIPPDADFSDDFHGQVLLHSIEEDPVTRSELRQMELQVRHHDHEVQKKFVHLLFTGWPDFLVPEGDDRNALVELVKLSAALNHPESKATEGGLRHAAGNSDGMDQNQDNPRIIHCSAGVGRSGTFIALDYLLSLMYAGELDNLPADRDPIAETVDLLRQQRMMMVQGESQFIFLYEIMRDLMSSRLASSVR